MINPPVVSFYLQEKQEVLKTDTYENFHFERIRYFVSRYIGYA